MDIETIELKPLDRCAVCQERVDGAQASPTCLAIGEKLSYRRMEETYKDNVRYEGKRDKSTVFPRARLRGCLCRTCLEIHFHDEQLSYMRTMFWLPTISLAAIIWLYNFPFFFLEIIEDMSWSHPPPFDHVLAGLLYVFHTVLWGGGMFALFVIPITIFGAYLFFSVPEEFNEDSHELKAPLLGFLTDVEPRDGLAKEIFSALPDDEDGPLWGMPVDSQTEYFYESLVYRTLTRGEFDQFTSPLPTKPKGWYLLEKAPLTREETGRNRLRRYTRTGLYLNVLFGLLLVATLLYLAFTFGDGGRAFTRYIW